MKINTSIEPGEKVSRRFEPDHQQFCFVYETIALPIEPIYTATDFFLPKRNIGHTVLIL